MTDIAGMDVLRQGPSIEYSMVTISQSSCLYFPRADVHHHMWLLVQRQDLQEPR